MFAMVLRNSRVEHVSNYRNDNTIDEIRSHFTDDFEIVEMSGLEDVPEYNDEIEELFYIDGKFIVSQKMIEVTEAQITQSQFDYLLMMTEK